MEVKIYKKRINYLGDNYGANFPNYPSGFSHLVLFSTTFQGFHFTSEFTFLNPSQLKNKRLAFLQDVKKEIKNINKTNFKTQKS